MQDRVVCFCLLLMLGLTASARAENWPQWRGPDSNGVSPEEGLPVQWSGTHNVAWKTRLPGSGVSSPIVWGDTLIVTSQLGRGAVRSGDLPSLSEGEEQMERGLTVSSDSSRGQVVFAITALNRENGSIRWEVKVPAEGALPEVHSKHNLATPSCVTDGSSVFCWFGTGQLVAVGMGGENQWEKSLANDYAPFDINWGHASSPALYDDTLFLLCDHRTSSYLLALDKNTGAEKWRTVRDSSRAAYSTPMVLRRPQGDELIVNSSEALQSFDPVSGELLWFFPEYNRFPVPSPSFGDGVIFTSRGYRSSPYLAVEPGGRGDISKSHVKWRVATGAPYVSSVVYYQGIVYFVSDSGIVTAADGATGDTLYKMRIGGVYSSSPVAGDGKVYLTNEGGDVTVLRAGPEAEILSRNELGERCLASPAISNGRLYFRSDQHVIAIGAEGISE